MNLHTTISVDGIIGYHLVHEDTLESKDSEIARLKEENDTSKEELQRLRSLVCKLDNALQSLKTQIVDTDGRDNKLRVALNAAKKENKHLKRLMANRGQYSSGDIESFDEKTPEELANLVEFEIGCGARTTFAAACLVLMQRRYKDVVRKNSILAERNGKLANAIKAAAQAAVTN
jgi:chromosome segregation ATPase